MKAANVAPVAPVPDAELAALADTLAALERVVRGLSVRRQPEPAPAPVERPAPAPKPNRLVRVAEMANRLGVHVKTLPKWVRSGRIPKPVRVAGVSGWTEETLAALLAGGAVAKETEA